MPDRVGVLLRHAQERARRIPADHDGSGFAGRFSIVFHSPAQESRAGVSHRDRDQAHPMSRESGQADHVAQGNGQK